MPKIIFTADYEHDFRPLKASCRLYRAAAEPVSVPTPVADAAIAAGCAKYPPKKKAVEDSSD